MPLRSRRRLNADPDKSQNYWDFRHSVDDNGLYLGSPTWIWIYPGYGYSSGIDLPGVSIWDIYIPGTPDIPGGQPRWILVSKMNILDE